MMVRVKSPRRVSGDLSAVKRSDLDDELHRRVIINFGRSVGASHLATQVLLQGAADDPQLRQDLLMGIDDQLRNMSLVLDNLVQFNVLRRGALVLDLKPINLQRWLPPLLAKWRTMAVRQGLDWREQLVSSSMPVRVDADRLAQVMSNLLSNATQYTPENGTVIVISGTTATDAWIRIDNSGPGLTADERPRVFEPFFASASQGTFPKGVGLGLTVAEWLVRALNGRLEFESDVGQGCSFTVWLPLEDHAAEPE
jgi:signal transduction histidine kinase